jgi:hypothetical protein
VGKSQNGEDFFALNDLGEEFPLKSGLRTANQPVLFEKLQQSEKKMKKLWRSSLFIR